MVSFFKYMSYPTTRKYSIASRISMFRATFALLFISFYFAFALPVWSEEESEHSTEEALSDDNDTATQGAGEGEGKRGDVSKDKSRQKKFRKVKASSVFGVDRQINHRKFDQAISEVAEIDAVLILDASRSMTRTDPKRLRDQGAKLFSRFLRAEDRLAVIAFDKDAKVVYDFMSVDPGNLTSFDQAIDSILTEGGFTNLEYPVSQALQLLDERGRGGVVRCVVLLSDGKMDPHPEQGSAAELTRKLFSEDLTAYKKKGVKLYTLALSGEADKNLLEKIALETDGQHWFAPDVDTIHLKFSDLFLVLKKPQLVPLQGEGFEIDSHVEEATFFITHKTAGVQISLIDPSGESISPASLPATLKWFKGKLYDVVTIKSPLPGQWRVRGVESPEGYATLLTDIALQVDWPSRSLEVGDENLVAIRLTEKGEVFSSPGLEEVTFYSYKIVNVSTGQVVSSGGFSDEGRNGDSKAGDKIFSTVIELKTPGDYKALIGVTSPTFTRQQQIPFVVRESLVKLFLDAADSKLAVERFRIVLAKQANELKNVSVKLIASQGKKEKALELELEEDEEKKGVYYAEATSLPPGNYKIRAALKGVSKTRASITSTSNELKYDVEPEREKVSTTDYSGMVGYLIGFAYAVSWAGALGYFSFKRASSTKHRIESLSPYVVPQRWTEKLNTLRGQASRDRREPTQEDLDMLKIDGIGGVENGQLMENARSDEAGNGSHESVDGLSENLSSSAAESSPEDDSELDN